MENKLLFRIYELATEARKYLEVPEVDTESEEINLLVEKMRLLSEDSETPEDCREILQLIILQIESLQKDKTLYSEVVDNVKLLTYICGMRYRKNEN